MTWAGLDGHRARACCAGIAEFSIYPDRAGRGRGIGRQYLTSSHRLALGDGSPTAERAASNATDRRHQCQ
jgi:L-amino acid N-acyltransferase YncA